MLTGLAAHERAALLGLSTRALVELGERDRRIFAAPAVATAGAVARLRRWNDARQPQPDLARLEFIGDDSVRELVLRVLRQVPTPVAWHAVEHVAWREVGRSAIGRQSVAVTPRAPAADQPHEIMLCGAVADSPLVGVIGHELGHSWTRPTYSLAATVRMTEREQAARAAVDVPRDRYVRILVEDEALADACANLWLGEVVRHTDRAGLAHLFGAEYDAAAEGAA